jgi:hypothetical protein
MAPETTATPLFSDLSAAVSDVPGAAIATSSPAGDGAAPASSSGAKDRSRPERVAGVAKDVLGAISPRRVLPAEAGRADLPTPLGIAALGLLLLAAIGIVAYVIHFVRHTPKEA